MTTPPTSSPAGPGADGPTPAHPAPAYPNPASTPPGQPAPGQPPPGYPVQGYPQGPPPGYQPGPYAPGTYPSGAYPPGMYPGGAYAYLPAKPPALPAEPVEYQHLLRGPRRKWWRPIVSFLLVVAGVAAASIGLLIFIVVGWLATGEDLSAFEELSLDFNNPVTFAGQNLWLAMLIPIAGLATWIAHGVRPGFVSSVVGRFRWGWFAWCLLVVVPLWLLYLGLSVVIFDGGSGDVVDTAGRPATWVALLVLTFLTTPLQSAGEEYLFRGWLMQQIGSYVKNTYAALAIAIVASSVVFALAHTSLDPWILIDLGAFATAAVLLTWRTGGLEAAVALHLVNNVVILSLATLTTGLSDSFITPETTGTPAEAAMSVTSLAIVTAVIWWVAGRRGVARRSTPASSGSAEADVAVGR